MKVILYMASTLNGVIAKHDDSADFITPAESESYVSTIKKSGAMVVGRRTYEILSTQPEFQEFLKSGIKIVAVSTSEMQLKDSNHELARSPHEALKILTSFEEVVVAGGANLNSSFLSENLIDEIYLDIEPNIVGEGIPLFNNITIDKKLKFISSKKLSKQEIQLHYSVIN